MSHYQVSLTSIVCVCVHSGGLSGVVTSLTWRAVTFLVHTPHHRADSVHTAEDLAVSIQIRQE